LISSLFSLVSIGCQESFMVPPCMVWWDETDNWASTVFLPVRPHCVNARQNRCQEDLNSFCLGELEEATRTPSYYVDEDYPARPEIQ